MIPPAARPRDRELFAGTASYYARYRPSYPSEVLISLAENFALGRKVNALDLGCGTGQLALPLSRFGCSVWAVDPDPDMLSQGVRIQCEGDYGNIRWILGRGEDLLSADLPMMRLCTMGAAFHWMDRDLVLQILDQVIDPVGGVALVSGSASIWSTTDAITGAWLEVTREVVTQFLGPQRRAGRGIYSHPERPHQDVLADSAFPIVDEQRYSEVRTLSVEDIVGLQLSTSYASPEQLGERLPEFRAELSRQLRELGQGEGFETVEHTDVIVARRADAGGDDR